MTEPDTIFADDNPETSLWSERIGKDVDSLTGFRQRTSFNEVLKGKTPGTFSVLFIDMDNLKQANDKAKSHALGDRALRTIADEINLAIRDRNGEGRDEAFRYGGDEFVVILDKVSDPKQLGMIAARIKHAIGGHVFNFGHGDSIRSAFHLTVSIGGSVSNDEIGVFDVVDRADKALYMAKEKKNHYVIFESTKSDV